MQPRTALSGVSFSLLIALAGCCPCTKQASPAAVSATQHSLFEPDLKQFTSNSARRAEVAALIEEATSINTDQDRAAFAFAAADRSSAELVKTINAINTARDVILHNLKNLDTIGFKASVYRINGSESQSALNVDQGSLENTGRPLDVSIQGPGFFKIKMLDSIGSSEGYTRNGNFFVNSGGELVLGLGDGYPLIPPIKFPQSTTEISISQNGTIEIIQAGMTSKVTVGQLRLTNFINPQGLQLQGSNIFTETSASGPPVESVPGNDGAGQLLQGFLESSNVDLIREKVRLRFLLDWKATLMKIVDK